MSSIFLSYARKDGRQLAERLQIAFQSAGHGAWLDTSMIPGGVDWAAAIETAIDDCDAAVAVLSDAALRSNACRAEQMRALRKGKHVIPVLASATADRPLYLEHLNFRDFSDHAQFDRAFATLLIDVASPRPVPLLPEELGGTTPRISSPATPNIANAIVRESELAEVRTALLGENGQRHVALTALHGMPGVETMLAAMACHDPLIAAAFPHGIYWLTIGREPGDMAAKAAELGQQLGDSLDQYRTVQGGVSRLTTILARRSILLVLDDVWRHEDVEPLLLNLPQCRTLLTTRDQSVAAFLGATQVKLGTMTRSEAVATLRRWSGQDGSERDDLDRIAAFVGDLPLALRIAGSRIREGLAPTQWLERFRQVADVKASRASVHRDDSLPASIELSVSMLSDGDRALFYSLGIFPEDAQVPIDTVIRLWTHLQPSSTGHDGRDLVDHLSRLSLVELDRSAGRLTLHDVLGMHAREQLGAMLPVIHRRLLEAYSPALGLWSTAPIDGYLAEHLLYHFDRMKERWRGRRLLEEDVDGRNGWHLARTAASPLGSYLGDVRTIARWASADASPEPGARSLRISCQIFCALCETSTQSLSWQVPSEVVARLVDIGLWSSDQAERHVSGVTNGLDRAAILTHLAMGTSGPEYHRLINLAWAAFDELEGPDHWSARQDLLVQHATKGFAVDALRRLARRPASEVAWSLPALLAHIDDEVALRQAMDIARGLDAYERAAVAGSLAAAARGGLRAEVIEMGLAAADQTRGMIKGEVYAALLPLMPDDRSRALWSKATAAIFQMPNPDAMGETLGQLAGCAAREDWEALLTLAFRKIADPDSLASFMLPLAQAVGPTRGGSIIDRLVVYARAFDLDRFTTAQALLAIAAVDVARRTELCNEVLELSDRMDDADRGRVLAGLIGIAPEALHAKLWRAVGVIREDRALETVVGALIAEPATPPRFALATRLALRIDYAPRSASLLGQLLDRAPGPRGALLARSLRRLSRERLSATRAEAEVHLLRFITDEAVVRDVFDRFRLAVDDAGENQLRSLVAAWGDHAPGIAHPLLIELAFSRSDVLLRRNVLQRLGPRLDSATLTDLLRRTGRIGDEMVLHGVTHRLAPLAQDGPGGMSPATAQQLLGQRLAEGGNDIDQFAAAAIVERLAASNELDGAMAVAGRLLRGSAAAAFRSAAASVARRSTAAANHLLRHIEMTAHESARALYFASILPALDPTARRTLVAATLATEPPPAQCALLYPHMTPDQRARFAHVFDDVLQLAENLFRDFEPLAIALPFVDEQRLAKLWRQTASIGIPAVEAHAKLILATRHTAWLEEGLHTADRIDQPERVAMLTHTALHLTSARQRHAVMERAASAARSLPTLYRAEAMLRCAIASEGSERHGFVEDALMAMCRTEGRDRDLELLVPFLFDFDANALEAAFDRILPILAGRTRADLASDLGSLAIPLRMLATTDGISDVIASIRKTSAWWP